MGDAVPNRRPLAVRSSRWAQAGAALLTRSGASPNAISAASVAFAAAGSALLLFQPSPPGLVVAALCALARGACNMFDGMVAIEGGRQTPTGPLFNEIPDRLSDSLLIVALGYAADLPTWGWFGALAAALTAYVRLLGGSLGFPQDFGGPMAKTRRIYVLAAGCVAGAVEAAATGTHVALAAASVVIALGAAATCVTRVNAIAHTLRSR